MNLPPLLIFFLLAHIIADFYLQSNKMAKMKDESYLWLIGHALIYDVCIALALFSLVHLSIMDYSYDLLWIFLLMSTSHLALDYLKRFAGKLKIKRIFTYDQLAHLAFIALTWCLWGRHLNVGYIPNEISQVVLIILGLLIIIRPIGTFIERGDWDFNKADQAKEDESQASKNASRLIGYLERIIIYLLLLSGQYTAIAFVITAKSIARFPEINDNEKHLQANYYIIGTLLSVTSVFAVTILLGLVNI